MIQPQMLVFKNLARRANYPLNRFRAGNPSPDPLVQKRIANTADSARCALCDHLKYGAERTLRIPLRNTPPTLLYRAADTSPLLSWVPH
eukprot:IDg2385t1